MCGGGSSAAGDVNMTSGTVAVHVRVCVSPYSTARLGVSVCVSLPPSLTP